MNKKLIFLVSGGRTGTAFFGTKLAMLIEDCFSVHEPDILTGSIARDLVPLRTFGLRHMVIDRLRGRTGIRNLTQRRLSGKASNEEIEAAIDAHRGKYYDSLPNSLIIESYYQWFGLLPAIRHVYPNCKVVGIVRDPRTWVTSWINFGSHHDYRDRVRFFGHSRLNPTMVADYEYVDRWNGMSHFEKLCWDWRTIYKEIGAFAESDSCTRIFRFEDLFHGPSRINTLMEMLDFMTRFEDRVFAYRLDETVYDDQINRSSTEKDNDWLHWRPDQARFLHTTCGDLMNKFDYGRESEWKLKIRE